MNKDWLRLEATPWRGEHELSSLDAVVTAGGDGPPARMADPLLATGQKHREYANDAKASHVQYGQCRLTRASSAAAK
jgi:hypothetical protein